MEKTKAELYLEKLQMWKEQRIKEKEGKQKNKQKIVLKKETVVPVKAVHVKPVPVYVKSTIKPHVKPVKQFAKASDKAKQPCIEKKAHIKSGISVTKTAPKSSIKVEKKRKSVETRELMQKLNKWREEKRSEKKMTQKSAVKAKEVPVTHSRPDYKVVKSRLFDYQSKPKPQSNTTKNQTNKENVFISKSAGQKTEILKAGVKRRFSEVQKVKPQQKPAGILKRKSCIGSFDLTDKIVGKSPVKRRRTSASNTESNKSTIYDNDEVFVDTEPPSCIESNSSTCKQLPTCAITPRVSARNVRFSTPPNNNSQVVGQKLRKTPKTPATRSAELKDWLKAKGKTPSKFRHLMCFHGKKHDDEKSEDPHTKNMLSVKELSQQMDVLEQERLQMEAVDKMNSMLDECMILFEAGCPMDAIVPWLDDIYKQIPCARNSARYYTCKANVIKSSLDLDAVLEIFEQATINNAQPKEDIAKCLTETVKYVTEGKVQQARKRYHTPRRSQVQAENMFESSAIVYTVSNVTPFSGGKRSSSKKACTPSQCQVVTPVRRSTRCSLQNLPESLKDKKKSFSSLDEVSGEDVLFQPNLALDTALTAIENS